MFENGCCAASSILVLVAALEEEEGIGHTLAEFRKCLGDSRLMVIDGNSRDRTVQIAKDVGAEVLCQAGKGKGDAIGCALRHLSNSSFDYVILTDGDYTYPAEHVPQMIRILEENPDVGMVCGNRFNHHLDPKAIKRLFYLGNQFLAWAQLLLNGVDLRDPLTGLRVVRWSILKHWKPKSKGFDIEAEMNHRVENMGYESIEIPIKYRPRLGNKKLRFIDGISILKRIITESLGSPPHKITHPFLVEPSK